MSNRKFEVRFGNKSRYVDAQQRDEMLLAGEIKQTGYRQYRGIPQVETYRRSATANTIEQLAKVKGKEKKSVRRYLGLGVIFEYKGQRKREVEQTPEGLILAIKEGKQLVGHAQSGREG